MEHEQKYAIATIQIPLKVSPNGKYETMLKNIHITFAPATAATIPKSNETEINGEFQNILKNKCKYRINLKSKQVVKIQRI